MAFKYNKPELLKPTKHEPSEVNKLMGIEQNLSKNYIFNKNEWKTCIYCEKYHPDDYYGPSMIYCIHCWGWLNAHEYNIETGIYLGTNSVEDIKKMIKKVYPVHIEANCNNTDCIFYKIKKSIDDKTLHSSLVELLGLNKKPKQEAICFNYKNKNLDVNFEESFITI